VRTLTIGGLAAARLRSGWATYLPTAFGLAIAIALATALTVTQSLTDQASLQAALARLGTGALVEVQHTEMYDHSAYTGFQQSVAAASHDDMQGLLTPRGFNVVAGVYRPDTFNGAKAGGDRALHFISLASYDDVQSHADLAAGSWPAAVRDTDGKTLLVSVPQVVASRLRLQVGDQECVLVVDQTHGFCARVAAIWVPRDLTEPYWGAERLVPLAFFVGPQAYFETVDAAQGLSVSLATAVLAPDLAAIGSAQVGQVLDRFSRLHTLFGVVEPNTTVSTTLDSTLQDFVERRRVAAFALQLVAAQLLLIALFYVAFLANHLLDQNRRSITVWRTRGWSWPGIASLLLVEMLVLAVVALPVGVAAGIGAAQAAAHLAYAGAGVPGLRLDPGALVAPVALAAAVGLLVIAVQVVFAARGGVLRSRAMASRPPTPSWRRRHLDLVLALLAVPLLAQARLLGSSDVRQAGVGEDPLSLVLPGLGLAFIALAAVRLLPLFVALASRLWRGVEQRLAAVQLRRAPGQHARLALLLTMTVALGIFASTYAGTSHANAADRADYAAGADLRAIFGGAIPPDLQTLRVDGASAQSAVFRGYGRPGGGKDDVSMLGVDPFTLPGVAWTRPGLTPAPLDKLLEPLATGEQGGLVVPANATGLSLWVDGAGTGSHLSARLSDGLGRPVHADFGVLDYSGWRQLSAPLVAEVPPIRAPLRFRELRFDPPRTPGRIGISDLAAGGTALATFERAPSETDSPFSPNAQPGAFWWATDQDSGVSKGALSPQDADVRRDGTLVDTVWLYEPGGLPTYVRPTAAHVPLRGRLVTQPVPALIASGALQALQLKLGDVITLAVDNVFVPARLVGTTDYFPTLYPAGGEFFVLQEDLLLMTLGEANHQRPWAGELWVSAPRTSGIALAALRRVPQVVDVVARAQMESDAVRAPQQLGLESNLGLGFAAALVLALVGFALHFLLVARSRQADYAILQANGMSGAQVRGSLAVEQLVLLAFSLAAGAALGALLAVGLLPVLQSSSAQADLVPPTVLTADPRLVLGALAVVGAGGLLAGRVIASAAEPRDLMTELRALG